MSELSVIYNPANFIKTVVDSRYIQIQDTYGDVKHTLDYQEFASAIPSGRFLTITQDVSTDIKLQFTSSDKTLTALNKLIGLIEKLKDGTYIEPSSEPKTTTPSLDYSEMFTSDNFIRKVIGNDIEIQNSDASSVVYTLDYTNVTTTMNNNRFLLIYTNNENITLQFSTTDDAILAHNILRETIDQLKDNTYNVTNTNANNVYDPDTFIYEISFNDYTIRLVNNKGEITSSIVAKQVTTVYVYGNTVKVKTEASDLTSSYSFETTAKAIIGAEKLRQAIKTIVDKNDFPDSDGIKYFTKEFESDVWIIDPEVTFSMSGISLTYYELVCPSPTQSCLEEDKVRRECEGLVEYDGNIETDILDKITIYFNQSVKGVATLIGR